jgi:hypothetical protein
LGPGASKRGPGRGRVAGEAEGDRIAGRKGVEKEEMRWGLLKP